MIVFDTDHLSILQHPGSPACDRLLDVMRSSLDRGFAATVVSLEEQMRGWLAAIRRARSELKQTQPYAHLLRMHRFYEAWNILPFDDRAARTFTELRKQGVRVGTLDLKIASIALVHGARVVSSNLRDFGRIPRLMVEDWRK